MTTIDIETPTYVPHERLSYSSLQAHRKCPQAWSYRYLKGLTTIEESSPPQAVGIWWHAIMAAYAIESGGVHGTNTLIPALTPETLRLGNGEEVEVTDSMGAPLILSRARRYWTGLSEEEQQPYIDRYGVDLPHLLSGMLSRWEGRWIGSHEEVLGVEVEWTRALPGTPYDSVLKGYVDLVYRDTKRGVLAVRDWKSSKTLEAAESSDDLMDSQLHLYVWGVTPKLDALDLGPVQAVSYDRIRTTPPATPQVTQAGTLSKSVTAYDLDTYLGWAEGGVEYPGRKKDGSDAGVYRAEESVIEKLSAPVERDKWTTRTLTPVNRHVVRTHLLAAIDGSAQMEATTRRVAESGEAPRNLVATLCRYCDFSSLCRAQMLGGNDGEYPLGDYGLRHRDDAPGQAV